MFNELGEVVGIAFQSYAGSDAENIGYVRVGRWLCVCLMGQQLLDPPPPHLSLSVLCLPPACLYLQVIPTPVIHHFLVDFNRNGAFTGGVSVASQ